MTQDEIRSAIYRALTGVAPEADPETLQLNVPLRDQLDIDSMDFLNFVIALHQTFRIEIPERDYPQLATLQGCIDYLSRC
jgi:acyl carrier protein